MRLPSFCCSKLAVLFAALFLVPWFPITGVSAATKSVVAKSGEPAGVETLPDEGRWHLEPGRKWHYKTNPPTSGPHDPEWVDPGFYSKPKRSENLVHSMEHGIVIIYYDRPGTDVLSTLKKWTKRYRGDWDGIIVTPLRGLGEGIVLTAWRKRLRLEKFDAGRAQAFVDSFRGKGPESDEKMGCR